MKHTAYRVMMHSMYRTAISDHLDLDIRYAAVRNMQRIKEQRRMANTLPQLRDVAMKYRRWRRMAK